MDRAHSAPGGRRARPPAAARTGAAAAPAPQPAGAGVWVEAGGRAGTGVRRRNIDRSQHGCSLKSPSSFSAAAVSVCTTRPPALLPRAARPADRPTDLRPSRPQPCCQGAHTPASQAARAAPPPPFEPSAAPRWRWRWPAKSGGVRSTSGSHSSSSSSSRRSTRARSARRGGRHGAASLRAMCGGRSAGTAQRIESAKRGAASTQREGECVYAIEKKRKKKKKKEEEEGEAINNQALLSAPPAQCAVRTARAGRPESTHHARGPRSHATAAVLLGAAGNSRRRRGPCKICRCRFQGNRAQPPGPRPPIFVVRSLASPPLPPAFDPLPAPPTAACCLPAAAASPALRWTPRRL